MTAEFARRNNDQWPRMKRSTNAAINEALVHFRQSPDLATNMENLRSQRHALKAKLELHQAGARSVTAADVYRAATNVAAFAVRLMEEGTAEFSYASHGDKAAPDLFTEHNRDGSAKWQS